jgi:type II secretory pathway pseudopilin PulG
MSPKLSRIAWGSVLTACVVALVVFSTGQAQNENSAPVATLIPQKAVLFVDVEGTDVSGEAYSKTAAHKALVESGLMPMIEKVFEQLAAAQPGGAGAIAEQAEGFFKHIEEKGVTFAVSLADPVPGGPPIALPQAIVVLKGAGKFAEPLSNFILQSAGSDINVRVVGDRSIESFIIPNSPGVEVAWWKEGSHLVLTAGINSAANHIAVLDGSAPNLMSSELWKEFGKQRGFSRNMLAWLDIGAIRDTYGQMPLPVPSPEPLTINAVAEAFGLDNLGAVVTESGFKGEATWSETHVQVDGDPKGLLALADQSPFTLKDLPPMPVDTTGFAAVSFDSSKFYDTVLGLIRNSAKFGPPDAADQVEDMIAQIPQMIGFDPKADLFDSLGSTMCFYLDGGQPIFFMFGGPVLAVEVKDAEKLRKSIDQLLVMGEGMSRGELEVARVEKQGREIILLGAEGAQAVSLCVDDKWLLLSLQPQSIETFAMRLDGKLDKWAPSAEIKAALADLPESYTSIAINDPRPMYKGLIGMAPTLANFARVGIKQSGMFPPDFELPFSVADVPPAELVTQHLFPNIAIGTKDAKGFHSVSRSSLPSLPFIGEMSGVGGVATVGIAVALILPAVQQARMAARRSQSRNNLKQIALALHNYHEVHGAFPAGTIENEDLKVEERLSWIVSILPFLDQSPLFDVIDQEQGWKDDDNADWTSREIPSLVNPQVADAATGVTHYVGIAGIGKDAATLPVNDKKAGVFGYNRKLRFRDVKDGASNTIGVTEASKGYGSWGAGGKPTIRSLTKKPYINGPDGIGSPFPGGMNAMLLDGSVRFISENIDPTVMEALVTINGGERVGNF